MGILLGKHKNRMHSGEIDGAVAFWTSPYDRQGWVFANGKKSKYKRNLLIAEGESMEMAVDLTENSVVTFTNVQNNSFRKEELPQPYLDEDVFIFVGMDHVNDKVTLSF